MAEKVFKGQEIEVLNITLSATVDTEVDVSLPPDRKANSYIIQCRTAVDMTLRYANNSSLYFTIKSGTVLHLDLKSAKEAPFYLRAASGTPVAEVIALF